MRLKGIFSVPDLQTLFPFQIADKREPGDRLPLAPEAHRAGGPVGAA